MRVMINLKVLFFMIITMICSVDINAQNIDSLLKKAFLENLELKSLVLDFNAAVLRAEQVNQLNSPTLGIATPIQPTETRLGPQVLMVSASQMLPWFGTLRAKEDVVMAMSKAVYENYVVQKLEVEYTIKSAYLSLQLIAEKKKILIQKESIISSLRSIVLAKVESGKATVADVLRLEIQLESIRTAILLLNQHTKNAEAKINKEIHVEIISSILLTDSLYLEPVDSISIVQYRSKIEQFHPLLKQLDALVEKSREEQQLSKLNGRPQFAIGLYYGLVNERTDANPLDNGRDIFIPKVMVSVPLYRKTHNKKIQEEQIVQESLELKKEALEDKMVLRIQKSLLDIEMAKLNYKLALGQTEKASVVLDILLAQYSSSGIGFDELLNLINDLDDYKDDFIQSIFDQNIARIEINRVLGF